jgi:hypothetical protein
MKIELTDKQVDNFLTELPVGKLYAYLAGNPRKSFKLFRALLFDVFNSESYVAAIYSLLEEVPIQKELF